MALTLLEGTASERTMNLCKVVVHFKAGLGLYASQLHAPRNEKVRGYVKDMQLRHLSAALTALDAVSFMAPPSLLLLQALVTGVSGLLLVVMEAYCFLNLYSLRIGMAHDILGRTHVHCGQLTELLEPHSVRIADTGRTWIPQHIRSAALPA